jgi:hypothetical protein
MRKTMTLIAFFAIQTSIQAQTKVFKEVSNEISSQIRSVRQDNTLVGYVVFTRLEKANADSFNYRITIMDENLNDIGTVNFKEQSLTLADVSFEQDMLCVAYLKSNIIGNTYTRSEFKKVKNDNKTFVMLQFLGLDGKIVKTNSIKANIEFDTFTYYEKGTKMSVSAKEKYPIQVNNIPNKGFAFFFGEENNTNIIFYSPVGNQLWQKKLGDIGQFVNMRNTGNDIYVLTKQKDHDPSNGGYQLLGYAANDGSPYQKFALKDKQGNELRVLDFDYDPSTSRPYLSGDIINPERGGKAYSGKEYARGPYVGVFTINLNGVNARDFNQVYSYWGDGSQGSSISKTGKFAENDAYEVIKRSFRDYEGNTYFVGSALIKKTRWGAIGASVITAPLLVPPIMILGNTGTSKCKLADVMVMKQNAKGVISFDNNIAANPTSYYMAKTPFYMYDGRSIYQVTNPGTKTNYFIVDDAKNIVIYNANQKKILRTIPHKEGDVKTNVYLAKEGHILVSEYNQKEKYTQFSIEAL